MSHDPNQSEAKGAPETELGASGPTEKSSGFTVLIWMAVIAALGAAWLWLGRSEPKPPARTELPQLTAELGKAPTINPAWAEAVQPRDNPQFARRGEVAKRMIARQGLGVVAKDKRPDWNAARARALPGVPTSARGDAAATPRVE